MATTDWKICGTAVNVDRSGDLYCSLALSQSRTLADGESLDVSITVKVSEA